MTVGPRHFCKTKHPLQNLAYLHWRVAHTSARPRWRVTASTVWVITQSGPFVNIPAGTALSQVHVLGVPIMNWTASVWRSVYTPKCLSFKLRFFGEFKYLLNTRTTDLDEVRCCRRIKSKPTIVFWCLSPLDCMDWTKLGRKCIFKTITKLLLGR